MNKNILTTKFVFYLRRNIRVLNSCIPKNLVHLVLSDSNLHVYRNLFPTKNIQHYSLFSIQCLLLYFLFIHTYN